MALTKFRWSLDAVGTVTPADVIIDAVKTIFKVIILYLCWAIGRRYFISFTASFTYGVLCCGAMRLFIDIHRMFRDS